MCPRSLHVNQSDRTPVLLSQQQQQCQCRTIQVVLVEVSEDVTLPTGQRGFRNGRDWQLDQRVFCRRCTACSGTSGVDRREAKEAAFTDSHVRPAKRGDTCTVPTNIRIIRLQTLRAAFGDSIDVDERRPTTLITIIASLTVLLHWHRQLTSSATKT